MCPYLTLFICTWCLHFCTRFNKGIMQIRHKHNCQKHICMAQYSCTRLHGYVWIYMQLISMIWCIIAVIFIKKCFSQEVKAMLNCWNKRAVKMFCKNLSWSSVAISSFPGTNTSVLGFIWMGVVPVCDDSTIHWLWLLLSFVDIIIITLCRSVCICIISLIQRLIATCITKHCTE